MARSYKVSECGGGECSNCERPTPIGVECGYCNCSLEPEDEAEVMPCGHVRGLSAGVWCNTCERAEHAADKAEEAADAAGQLADGGPVYRQPCPRCDTAYVDRPGAVCSRCALAAERGKREVRI